MKCGDLPPKYLVTRQGNEKELELNTFVNRTTIIIFDSRNAQDMKGRLQELSFFKNQTIKGLSIDGVLLDDVSAFAILNADWKGLTEGYFKNNVLTNGILSKMAGYRWFFINFFQDLEILDLTNNNLIKNDLRFLCEVPYEYRKKLKELILDFNSLDIDFINKLFVQNKKAKKWDSLKKLSVRKNESVTYSAALKNRVLQYYSPHQKEEFKFFVDSAQENENVVLEICENEQGLLVGRQL
ncbi:MAG: hypothetical protein ACTSXG_03175 [Alphaproteobacteria bacterium]